MNSTCIWLLYKYLDEEWLVKAFEFFSDLKRDFHWSNDWKKKKTNKQTNTACYKVFKQWLLSNGGKNQNKNPNKIQKSTPKKSHAECLSLKNFQFRIKLMISHKKYKH